MKEAPRLAEMLRAIATGSAVDWDTVDATPSDESTSSLIAELKVLSRIAEVHGTVRRDAETRSADAEPLSSWGPLAILECVGRGSYGDVYRAWDTRLDREVALKLLRRRAAPDASPVIEEGRLLARVRHPNAITVYGADSIDGRAGVWMEFVEGRTLEGELQERGPLPAAEVAALGIDICRALDAVHKAGVVHRDIKAQNVMRAANGRIVLMDFGSGFSDESGDVVVGGTPLYLAPEVLAGEPATIRSDIYAVGVLLYLLLTGRYPVEGSTLADVRNRHRHSPPVPLRAARSGLPKRLCAAIERAIALDPSARYESAAAFEAAISVAMNKQPTTWIAAAAVAIVMVAATSIALWRSKPGGGTSFVFRPHDLLLLTSFVNRTDERELDDVLEYTLERELSNSTHVGVAPRTRVEDTLRLIKNRVDARVDAALGRVICQRDGDIPALITGRVDKSGPSYIVSAEILACSDGRRVTTATEEASDVQTLSGAIRRIANRLRESLGEDRTAIQHSSQQLENVTPASPRALRLYSESLNLGTREEWPQALKFARDAVAADEKLATAQVWLAWAMQRNRLPRETYLPIADKAVKLSATAMEWERQWILGSYFQMAGDEERAIAAYRALAELRPDHFWGIRNLAQLLYRRRNGSERDKALPYAIRWADLRPHDRQSNLTAAMNILHAAPRDLARARPYVMRLQEDDVGPLRAWALFFDAAEHLVNRDIARVEAVVMRNLVASEKQPEMVRDAVRARAIRYFLTLGRGRQARALVEQFEDRVFYYPFYRTIVALSIGDTADARASVVKVPYNNYWIVTSSLLVRLGMTREAETFLNMAPPSVGVGRDFMLHGTVATARGEYEAAIPVLEQMAAKRWPGNHARTLADLASIWMRRANHQRAIDALRQSWDFDPDLDADVDGPYGHDWMPNALRLAALYRYAGRRHENAAPIEADLRRLLSTADPDFPLLVKLKQLDLGWFPGASDF